MSEFDFGWTYPPGTDLAVTYQTLILTCENADCPSIEASATGDTGFRAEIPMYSELGGTWPVDAYNGWLPDDLAFPRCPHCGQPLHEGWEPIKDTLDY